MIGIAKFHIEVANAASKVYKVSPLSCSRSMGPANWHISEKCTSGAAGIVAHTAAGPTTSRAYKQGLQQGLRVCYSNAN